MELPVKNRQGEVVDAIQVSDAVFGVPLHQAVVHQALVAQRANARQGTSSTKTRGEVSGGGRKPWRQKGTGRARQGSIRAPQWRKGGIAFGPKPRSYRQRLPKKMRRLAIRCLLSEKVRSNQLVVLDKLELETPRTKEMAQTLARLGIERSSLVVTAGPQKRVALSVHNLPGIKFLPAGLLNVGDLASYQYAVITVEGVRHAEALWSMPVSRGRGEPASASTEEGS